MLGPQKPRFPRLSSPHSSIKSQYDVVVVGSGYGASIAASRCARARQFVCVLERGKEWLPGDFPETFSEATRKTQVTIGGKGKKIGMQVFSIVSCFRHSLYVWSAYLWLL